VRFTPIDRARYDELSSDSPALRFAEVSFDLDEFEADPDGYNRRLLEMGR
jgi:hypothetical protein